MCKVQLRLMRRKINQNQKALKVDIEALSAKATRDRFRQTLEEKLAAAEFQGTVTQLNSAIHTAADEVLPMASKIRKPWISADTKDLADKKRSLKQRRHESESTEKEYRKLCNQVRKAARHDKDQWLLEQCEDIQQSYAENKIRKTFRLIKDINRQWQPRQLAVKNKNGKTLQSKEEVMERWTEYCSELYKDKDGTSPVVAELEKIAPPPQQGDDPILREEVVQAINKLKKRKSPGTDGIPGELIQAGGEVLIDHIHAICQKAWEQERMPEEWTKSVIITIPKKGDLRECSNYRTISLMNHMSKVMMMILLERLKPQLEPYLSEEQAGFRKDRSTIQQILTLRLMAEKALEKGNKIYNCFVDFQKAFDTIKQNVIWAVLSSYGIQAKLIRVLQQLYEQSKAAVKMGKDIGEWFMQTLGTKQGDPLSPLIFISHLERLMDKAEDGVKEPVSIHGRLIDNLRFADDIDLIQKSCNSLQQEMDNLYEAGRKVGLRVNVAKTKTMVFGSTKIERHIELGGKDIENVEEFVYLGSLVSWDNDCSKDIQRRIGKATGAFEGFTKVWQSKAIRIQTKTRILSVCVMSVLLYAAETWTLKKRDTN